MRSQICEIIVMDNLLLLKMGNFWILVTIPDATYLFLQVFDLQRQTKSY